jgi:hypothetical protein
MTASGFTITSDARHPAQNACQQDPEPAVRLRDLDSPQSGALQHFQLVSQGQDFEVECCARSRKGLEVSRSERSTETMAEKRTHRRPTLQLPQQERTLQ